MRKSNRPDKSGRKNPEGRDKAREGIKKAGGAAKEKVEKLREKKAGQTRTPLKTERRTSKDKPSPVPVNNSLTEQAMNFGAGPQAQAPGMPQGNPGMVGRPGMGQINPAMRGQRNVDLAGLRALQARMQGRQLGMY